MERILRAYHRLPWPAQVLAASLRGFQLRLRRYGRATDALVDAALERETWSAARWASYQAEQLAKVLRRAALEVPYYRERWAARRRAGDRASWEYLENWEVLEKETLRRNPRAFLADDCRPVSMIAEHTSGTTGTPLTLWRSLETERRWYALGEARWRRWNGLTRHDRWGILGGQLVVPSTRTKPPFWVWNMGLRQLYLSVYNLSPGTSGFYLDAMEKYGVTYLLGYSSALHTLAQGALRLGWPDGKLKLAQTNAEPLLPQQRETIAAAFGCPVQETYGLAEIVSGATECGAGRMHLWPEAGITECLDQELRPAPTGEAGELVCTGLLNADMPLVRYRVGDRARMLADEGPCRCGRTLPVIAAIEGRADEIVYTRDGRVLGRLDPVFKADLPLREAQIIQESLDELRILYVPDGGLTESRRRELVARVQQYVGPMHVILEQVPQIPRTANGKFRAVISNIGLNACAKGD